MKGNRRGEGGIKRENKHVNKTEINIPKIKYSCYRERTATSKPLAISDIILCCMKTMLFPFKLPFHLNQQADVCT